MVDIRPGVADIAPRWNTPDIGNVSMTVLLTLSYRCDGSVHDVACSERVVMDFVWSENTILCSKLCNPFPSCVTKPGVCGDDEGKRYGEHRMVCCCHPAVLRAFLFCAVIFYNMRSVQQQVSRNELAF